MGDMPGYRQITLYINPQMYAQASHVAKMVGEPVYIFVNKAIADAIKERTTPEQRKALEILSATSGGKKHEQRRDESSPSDDLRSTGEPAGSPASKPAAKKRKNSRKGRGAR